jgi:pimeloyl-ACP methyl ester carboxylesterase
MIGPRIDHCLTRISARRRGPAADGPLPTRRITMPAGEVRVFDSGSGKPCVVLAPDGPNVIEHYAQLIRILSIAHRVVCFDFPGFGHSLPSPRYTHSLDEGAGVVLGVLDALGITRATLAFSCANGFYALRTAQVAPHRITRVLLSQTPSMAAMHAWKSRVIPWPLGLPGFGQAAIWLVRERSAHGWYDSALPKGADREPFRAIARHAFSQGACWCLAGITQGLAREDVHTLRGVAVPCTLVWGPKDRSHRHTDPESLRDLVPAAEILRFADCGHFPDLEQPERFAALLG